MRRNAYDIVDGLLIALTDDGAPLCPEPSACPTCALFDRQRPTETRAEWLARIARPATAPGAGAAG